MAVVYDNADDAAAMHVETRRALKNVRRGVTSRAKANLEATEHTPRIAGHKDPADAYFPAFIEDVDGDLDLYTVLNAPNAMALEYGHAPSGFFKDRPSKPPSATYILNRAALGGTGGVIG